MRADALGPDISIPDDVHLVNTVVIAECVDLDYDAEGSDLSLIVRLSNDLPVWTAIGMLDAVIAQLRSEFLAGYLDGT